MQHLKKIKNPKVLLMVIIILIAVIGITWAIYNKYQPDSVAQEAEPTRNINVQALSGADESQIGTIVYAGAKLVGEMVSDNDKRVATLETPDSLDGAFNIYYQDLLNRYKSYKVDKTEISKDDALGGKAKVMTVHGETGTIVVTVWPKTDGMTQIEIVTSTDFK